MPTRKPNGIIIKHTHRRKWVWITKKQNDINSDTYQQLGLSRDNLMTLIYERYHKRLYFHNKSGVIEIDDKIYGI